MRLAVLILALVTATSAYAEGAPARNPFSPTKAPASTPAAAAPSANGAPQLPPLIPPPPPGLKLPPVVTLRNLPPSAPAKGAGPETKPASTPVDKRTPADEPGAASGPADAASAPPKEAPDVFLSRDAINKARAACQLELRGGSSLRVPAEGGVSRIQFSNVGGRSCFMGMQSDKAWAVIRGAGPSAAEVEVQANPTNHQRSTRLVIATANERWTLVLTQAPGSQELDELELDQEEE